MITSSEIYCQVLCTFQLPWCSLFCSLDGTFSVFLFSLAMVCYPLVVILFLILFLCYSFSYPFFIFFLCHPFSYPFSLILSPILFPQSFLLSFFPNPISYTFSLILSLVSLPCFLSYVIPFFCFRLQPTQNCRNAITNANQVHLLAYFHPEFLFYFAFDPTFSY